jgi:hypothetical protein
MVEHGEMTESRPFQSMGPVLEGGPLLSFTKGESDEKFTARGGEKTEHHKSDERDNFLMEFCPLDKRITVVDGQHFHLLRIRSGNLIAPSILGSALFLFSSLG